LLDYLLEEERSKWRWIGEEMGVDFLEMEESKNIAKPRVRKLVKE
jgi:hypothetical protein